MWPSRREVDHHLASTTTGDRLRGCGHGSARATGELQGCTRSARSGRSGTRTRYRRPRRCSSTTRSSSVSSSAPDAPRARERGHPRRQRTGLGQADRLTGPQWHITSSKPSRPHRPRPSGSATSSVRSCSRRARGHRGGAPVLRAPRRLEPAVVPRRDDEIARPRTVDDELREHIAFAQAQVRTFAELQRGTLTDFEQETLPGVVARAPPRPGRRGRLLLARRPVSDARLVDHDRGRAEGRRRPARRRCAPPRQGEGIHPPQLYAMAHLGRGRGLLRSAECRRWRRSPSGSRRSTPVDMIVGAGNAYVAEAKRQLFGDVGIDLLAGPTEILVIADETRRPASSWRPTCSARPSTGRPRPPSSSPTSRISARRSSREVERWLATTGRPREVAGEAWRDHGEVVVCADDDEVVAVSRRLRARAPRGPDPRSGLVPRAR